MRWLLYSVLAAPGVVILLTLGYQAFLATLWPLLRWGLGPMGRWLVVLGTRPLGALRGVAKGFRDGWHHG
jgi:hypothetical protein